MLHSLPYLAIVWRFEINRAYTIQSPVRPISRLALLLSLGLFLGLLSFWALPQWLNTHVGFSKEVFDPSLFLFAFWIFISIHHHLMDSVMWRRGNKEVAQHLFNSP